MTRGAYALTSLLVMAAVCAVAGREPQADAAQQARLDSRMGLANPRRYTTVQPKDWQNPHFVIRAEGIEVNATGLPRGGKIISPVKLADVLIKLPASAWPYGRVVAVQDAGISYPDDIEPIRRNREAALPTLKSLEVTDVGWPSS